MKRLFAVLLAVMLVASMATVASAENTTTLTTTVPAATYTLNIPADQEIPFGSTETEIGNVTVTNAAGFAQSKNLHVTFTYDDFASENVSTTIPFVVNMYGILTGSGSAGSSHSQDYESGKYIVFRGNTDGTVDEKSVSPVSTIEEYTKMRIQIKSSDWAKALGGEYSATITFTAEVVVE